MLYNMTTYIITLLIQNREFVKKLYYNKMFLSFFYQKYSYK